MPQITGVQCKEARMLLRWNVKDLSFRCGVDVRRLREFEALKEMLYQEENRSVVDAFEQEYVIFDAQKTYIDHSHGKRAEAMNVMGHQIAAEPQNRRAEEVLSRLLGQSPQKAESLDSTDPTAANTSPQP